MLQHSRGVVIACECCPGVNGIECATIGRVLTHSSSASDVVRMFDVPHDENCEMTGGEALGRSPLFLFSVTTTRAEAQI